MEYVENTSSAIDDLAEQLVTLHARVSHGSTEQNAAPVRSDTGSPGVQFDIFVFNFEESTELEARFAAGFEKAPHGVHFLNTKEASAIYDCSHVRHPSESRSATPPGFCVDIGAPKSVVGRTQLKHVLQYICCTSICACNRTILAALAMWPSEQSDRLKLCSWHIHQSRYTFAEGYCPC